MHGISLRPVALAFCLMIVPAAAQNAPAGALQKAQALLAATEADIKTSGVPSIAAHVPDLEQALLDAKPYFSPIPDASGTVTVLTDGPTESLFAMGAAVKAATENPAAAKKTVAVRNPYQLLSFYLGFYYNDISKPTDALRVLDLGLSLSPAPEEHFGVHVPQMLAERGAALNALKRFTEGLADYDLALTIKGLPPADYARSYRGRGLALTEMGRLDDAEASYKEALKLVPDDTRSQNELQYIAKLRAGGPAGPVTFSTKPPPPP